MIWAIVALIPIGLLMAVGAVMLLCFITIIRGRRGDGITQPLMWWGVSEDRATGFGSRRSTSKTKPLHAEVTP